MLYKYCVEESIIYMGKKNMEKEENMEVKETKKTTKVEEKSENIEVKKSDAKLSKKQAIESFCKRKEKLYI